MQTSVIYLFIYFYFLHKNWWNHGSYNIQQEDAHQKLS